MTIWESVAGVAVLLSPLGGWIISVERRISRLLTIEQTVDKMDAKLDRLVDRLLDE